MRSTRAAGLLVVVLAGCVHPVRREVREVPVETGLEVPFVAESPRRWDFADGSPAVEGAQVRHAFARAGRYVVRGFAGEQLRDEITLVARPRAALRLVPADATAAVVARDLEELGPVIDFLERLVGAPSLEARLDEQPLLGWVLEQASALKSSPVDPREGLAAFSWPLPEGVRGAVVGVIDGAAASSSLAAYLGRHEWRGGPGRFTRAGRALDVFLDRGALYVIDAPEPARVEGLVARVRAGAAQGLEADPRVGSALDALPSGGVVLFAKTPSSAGWRFATAALRVTADRAHLEGRLHGDAPLWAPAAPPASLLANAPEGPIAVASASAPPAELLSLAFGAPGTPRRKELELDLAAHGADLTQVIAAFGGLFELALYADVGGFVRGTVQAEGRPQPAGTVLLEALVREPAPMEALIETLAERWGLPLRRLSGEGLHAWRGRLRGQPLELALSGRSLFLKAGSPLDGREPVDLATALTRRFDGAFGPGHLSLFVDLGQLRRELLQPRLLDGVDPRRAITAQALAVTLLDRLTQLDSALLDVSPLADGAAVQLVLELRPREASP